MFAKHLCHVLANYKTHEKELVTTTTILPEQSHGVSSPPPVEAGPVARFEPVWIRADFFCQRSVKINKENISEISFKHTKVVSKLPWMWWKQCATLRSFQSKLIRSNKYLNEVLKYPINVFIIGVVLRAFLDVSDTVAYKPWSNRKAAHNASIISVKTYVQTCFFRGGMDTR